MTMRGDFVLGRNDNNCGIFTLETLYNFDFAIKLISNCNKAEVTCCPGENLKTLLIFFLIN